jgi:putative membrane protein insertion efficiency factor
MPTPPPPSEWPRQGLIALVRFYRFFLSPWLGSGCRFEPTCSLYALQALQRHGAARGGWLTAGRLMRCHPWCAGGCDPVPENPRFLARRDFRPDAADPPPASHPNRP